MDRQRGFDGDLDSNPVVFSAGDHYANEIEGPYRGRLMSTESLKLVGT